MDLREVVAAFGITEDDVSNVLSQYALHVRDSQGKAFEDMARDLIDLLDQEAIGKAALDGGDDLPTQTNAAYSEIAQQLVDAGVLNGTPRKPQILGAGEAPRAARLGCSIERIVHGTEAEMTKHFAGGYIAVPGAAVHGRPGAFEWAIMSNLSGAEDLKLQQTGQDVEVIEVATLDQDVAAQYDKPWICVEESNTVHQFDDEDSACVFQREYRVKNGLDPMTGESRQLQQDHEAAVFKPDQAVVFNSTSHGGVRNARGVVVRPLTSAEADLDDVGAMYRIRLNDGTEVDAFVDELSLGEERKLVQGQQNGPVSVTLQVAVTTHAAGATPEAIRKTVQRLIDGGLEDATDTLENDEGDVEGAQFATDLNIAAPVVVERSAASELAAALSALNASQQQEVAWALGFDKMKTLAAEMLYAYIPEEAVAVAMDALTAEHARVSGKRSSASPSP